MDLTIAPERSTWMPTARVGIPVAMLSMCLMLSASSVIAQGTSASALRALPAHNGHALFHGRMPAGTVAATRQMMASHPMRMPHYQPVRFQGPSGSKFSLAGPGGFEASEEGLMAGLRVGAVYRFRITEIPGAPGTELFPTIEVIDRTYPPTGLELKYPVPLSVDADDLNAAMSGQLVTRVIYLEDPQTAVPLPSEEADTPVIDLRPLDDSLATADRLGRPIAILRIGSLAPPTEPALAASFFLGYPEWAPVFQPKP
ncbi:MAG: hypothetical protein AAGD07_01310 [Planctomycetota bacterium]